MVGQAINRMEMHMDSVKYIQAIYTFVTWLYMSTMTRHIARRRRPISKKCPDSRTVTALGSFQTLPVRLLLGRLTSCRMPSRRPFSGLLPHTS